MMLLESWATDALTSSLLLAAPVAMLAGLLSFLSPCVLPLLPGYLSYATGLGASQLRAGEGSRRAVLMGTLGFVLGFSLVFVLTGALVGGLGVFLIQHSRVITIISGLVIMLLAAVFMGLIPLPAQWKPSYTPKAGAAFSPLLGMVFAIGWTPCIGPVLSMVLTMAFSEANPGRGAFLAFAYALGLGIPFIVCALAFNHMANAVSFFNRHLRAIQLVGGGILLMVGLAMVTGWWDSWLASLRQWVSTFGTIL